MFEVACLVQEEAISDQVIGKHTGQALEVS